MVTEAERFHPAALEDWRDWLATNHTRREGVWVVGWRARSGRTAVRHRAGQGDGDVDRVRLRGGAGGTG